MSRIGKQPIPVPSGVKVTLSGRHVSVQGPKGKLDRELPPMVTLEVGETELKVTPDSQDRVARGMHGLARTLVNNMVVGVVTPFKKVLEVSGVGYRAEVLGDTLKVQCGYSHDVLVPVPPGVTCKIEKQTTIQLESPDKELLGQTAATIRAWKPCEPYKGKGIKYSDERIRRKEGKTGAG